MRNPRAPLKTLAAFFAFALLAPCAQAAEPFCGTGRLHPIDVRFEQDMARSDGVTLRMREAQAEAHARWDAELNREYRALAARLPAGERATLREAQRAWLAFRDAEARLWWSESISQGGTLQPVVVADLGRDLLRSRVCQLVRYQRDTAP